MTYKTVAASESNVLPYRPARPDRRYVTAALMLVMVLASLEQTITSTAMPTMIGELHGFEHYSWVVSIYLLALTVSMPLYGRLSDVLGRKRVILGAIVIFSVGSAMAAFAHTMNQLILYRGVQGLGAGGIMPVVLTILGDIFTLEERATIQGLFSAIWGIASLAGPALGAFLVTTLGWRSIFFVNLPPGILGLIVLIWKYHDREKPHSTDLDLPGVATLSIACTGALLLASGVGPVGHGWGWTLGLLVVSLISLVAFLRIERIAPNAIMPPALMMRRAIGPAMLGSFLLGAGFLCLDTYVPLYVQGGRGGGVGAAASVVTPVMLTWALSGIIAAPLVVNWGFRNTALLGSGLIIVGFTGLLLCAFTEAPRWVLTGVLALTGCGFGPASMAYLLAAQNAVGWQQRGIMTSGIQFFRTIGGAIGTGLMGMLFNVLIAPQVERLRAAGVDPATLLDTSGRHPLPTGILASVQHMISGGLLWVFVAITVFACLQILATTLMVRGRASHGLSRAEAIEAIAA
ncbi:MAG TPA: MDR family MFS transporter [Tepidisphaeraceae bacterium]|nr:MDR family MFS transporter [Tepidisphaeraceae bacterium]